MGHRSATPTTRPGRINVAASGTYPESQLPPAPSPQDTTFRNTIHGNSVAIVSRRINNEEMRKFSLTLRSHILCGSVFCRFGRETTPGKTTGRAWRSAFSISCAMCLFTGWSYAQQDDEPGHRIGTVSTNGDLIVMKLDHDVLGKANLFDLTGRTLRITPDGSSYRVESAPLHWDSDYGHQLAGAEVVLRHLSFPFSEKLWNSFFVGATGCIRFGVSVKDISRDPYGHLDGGIFPDRFDQLAEFAEKVIDRAPAICVFLKPRLYGPRYVKELPDRVVITWDLTEPFGSLLDFTWFKTINRFQAVLSRDGSMEMSYKQLAAKDAIVGIYPTRSGTQRAAAVHFSSLSHKDGPFAGVYEAFHYVAVPKPQDLSCTIIRALGDKFDFLAYYSDFRIDSHEGSTPSDGPVGGSISGIGNTQHKQTPEILKSRCTAGRFQLGFEQPEYVGS